MKKKIVSLNFNSKKYRIELPKFLSKMFQKQYNKENSNDEDREATEFKKHGVIYKDMLIIPINNNMYDVDNLINASENIVLYEKYMHEEMKKLNNEGGIYLRMDFNTGTLSLPYWELSNGEYFQYNNNIFLKLSEYHSIRLVDNKNFISVIEDEDKLKTKVDKTLKKRDYSKVLVTHITLRDKRL